MPDGSKRDAYSVNCGNKSYHTEDLADAKRKFKSWCKTGDCTLHHGRQLLDSNFEQPAPKPLGLFLHAPGYRPAVKKNGSGFTATHKKILKDYIEAGGNACDFDDLPSSIRSKLKAAGYPETLESDAERFLWDNNNPHLKRSKLWGNPSNEEVRRLREPTENRKKIEERRRLRIEAEPTYSVVVGNVGTVYSGKSAAQANHDYSTYRRMSRNNEGRCAGEDVTMLKDGEIFKSWDAADRTDTSNEAPRRKKGRTTDLTGNPRKDMVSERNSTDVFIRLGSTDGEPVLSFVIGDKDYQVSAFFKATNNVLAKAIDSAVELGEPNRELVAQIRGPGLETKISNQVRDYIIDFAEKYGAVKETWILREKKPRSM